MKVCKVVKIFIVTVLVFTMNSFNVQGQTAQQQTDQQATEELEKNVDRAIKILKIIKKEVAEEKKEQERAAKRDASNAPDEEWTLEMKRKLRRVADTWSRVREALKPEDPAVAAKQDQDTDAMIADLNDKLEQSIEAMSIIKEELDRLEAK